MKFGQYAVIQPVTYNFEKEPEWHWKFKPPTAKDELELQRFLFQKRSRTTPDGMREQLPATSMEVVFRQLALTFGGTNIPKYVEVKGEWQETEKPILKEDDSVEEIEKVLGEMPAELIQELWNALGEHVPNWGPVKEDPKD
jgi:hypothetical protein